MFGRIRVLIGLSALFLPLALAAQDKPRLAVRTIKPNDVSKAMAEICRSFVGMALIKTEVFSVISSTDIEQILKAQEFSLSDCTDEKCAISIGELLAAEQIVIGELSAIGSWTALNLRLLDVATGRGIRAEAVSVGSGEELRLKEIGEVRVVFSAEGTATLAGAGGPAQQVASSQHRIRGRHECSRDTPERS